MKEQKIGQFVSSTTQTIGGGERVMDAIFSAFGARVFTFNKKGSRRKNVSQIGEEIDRRLSYIFIKE